MSSMLTILIFAIVIPLLVLTAIIVWVRNMSGGSKKKQAQAQALIATGRKARATILRIDPTGMVVNNINIQCLVTFRLQPLDGRAAFDGQKKMLINQTQMPRVGDVWPSWYDITDPSLFAVGMPDGASTEQIPIFREFGIPHPLDPQSSTAAAPTAPATDAVAQLERLSKLHEDGDITDEEFAAAKARLLGT